MEICNVQFLFLCFMRSVIPFFLFLIIFGIPFESSAFHLPHRWHPRLSNASDQEALLGFRSAIKYDPSRSVSDTWKSNVSFCHWKGIICSRRRQRVISLDVSNMGLQGTISPLLGNLSFLRILNLTNNSFHGHIPYQLGSLFRLKMLYLSRNELQGSIPPALGGCRSLRYFSMAYNNVTGILPSQLCLLPTLKSLWLHDNNLMGTIPGCLGNISSLKTINLDSNILRGIIPSELSMLSQLSFIYLAYNHLTGQIPSSLSNCTNLQELYLSANHLIGRIPMELCSKNNGLIGLYLSDNQLSGSIPVSLLNCTKLQLIDLGSNQLSGELPLELGTLTQLQALTVHDNYLVSGGTTTSLPILNALTNCSTLHTIDMSSNNLTGRLPFSIGHLSPKMDLINLGLNDLVGEIPPHIGNLSSLTAFQLSFNFLTGVIPPSFYMLQGLERLLMGNNNLQGSIPKEIGQLKRLGLLELGGNNLSGRIPDFVADPLQLRYLSLAQNQLSGNIPVNLGKCVNLLALDLSYNKLSGHIPPQVAGLQNLALYFDLSNNLLYGSLPLELSKMTMVQVIDISANRLTGYIPSALGSCKEVESLNLSYNALEGPIPVSLGELQSLKDMDFSFNNLTGGIPMSFENLKMLSHLNFSFNKLSGEVPKGGIFRKLNATAFVGNPNLCGPWVSLLPCFVHKHKGARHLKRDIILVVVGAVILALFLLFGIWWIRKSHILRKTRPSLIVGHKRISYGELISATEEFSDANLLGVGSFGKVYKGVLNDGTIVAIKLLNLEIEGAFKSFDRECKVLGRVRHRNLIRIITTYADHQTKALIFPLMPNGSLNEWLYPEEEVESGLSFIQRLNIAIDIAHGMEYLHHHCFVQVIHCDLKPNNVLLGEDMTAYLTDFGIATICFEKFENSSLTSTHVVKGSTGYIPPEYGLGGHVTTKGDVYSYGIVLLEMLTRKKPIDDMFVEGLNLHKWVGSHLPNQVGEVLDKSLLRRINTNNDEDKELTCLRQLVSVGFHCTNESPERRPTMMNIVSALQSIKDTFLGVVGNTKIQSNITNILASTSTAHKAIDDSQSSSTF